MGYTPSGQQYATIAQLQNVVSPAALTHPTINGTSVQNDQLLRASEEADAYLAQQYKLPLVQWGSDLVQHVCDIAVYRLICLRGFNPEKDGLYRDNYNDSLKWLRQVARCEVSPDITDQTSGNGPHQQSNASTPSAFSPHRINSSGTNTRGSWRR